MPDDSPAGQPAQPERGALGAPERGGDQRPHTSGRLRTLDRLTGLLLIGAFGVTVAASMPAALRALGAGAQGVSRGAERIGRLIPRPAHAPTRRPPPFGFDMSDYYDEDGRPTDHRTRGEDEEDDDDTATGADRVRLAVAPKGLRLLRQPTPHSEATGEVDAGELVMVVGEAGDWVLVVRTRGDGLVTGWARRSEIAIR